jgi:PAS domain S-box-containing protein
MGFSALIFLCLAVMITVETIGIPGTANKGKFATYRARSLSNLELVSGLLDERITSWFKERRRDVDGLTSSPLLRQAIESRNPQLSSELAAFLRSNPAIESIAIIDPRDASIRAADGGFRGARSSADIGINTDRFSRLAIPGYQEIIDTRYPADKKPRYRITRQVFSTASPDRIIAILVTEINIFSMLYPYMLPTNNLLSNTIECIIASNHDDVVTQFRKSSPTNVPHQSPLSEISASSPIRLAFSGIAGPYEGSDRNGNPILAFHRQIKLNSGLTLALVLKMDRALVLAPAWADLSHQCILWLSLFIVGSGLCLYLAQLISRPLKELVAVAHRVEAGDFTARATVSGLSRRKRTETDHLASVLNSMITRIQTWHLDLEQQIVERTGELQSLYTLQDAILAAVPDIIMELDSNQVYTWSNSAGFEFFGEDVLGKEASLYFVRKQNTFETIPPPFEVTEKAQYLENWQQRKDGEIRLLAWWFKALTDEHGGITDTVLTARDITENRRAVELLRESEERFKSMFRKHSAIMLLIEPEHGAIIDANLAAEEFYGYTRETLLTMCISNLNTLSQDEISAEMNAALAEQRNCFIFPHKISTGAIRTVEVHSTAMTLHGTIRLFSIIHDITERKRAEEELHQKNAEIEQFMYTVSHDLRSPLVTVKTFMGYLEKDLSEGDREQLTQDIQYIHGAADKMKLLLDELLEFSRIGRIETAPVDISLKELIAEVLDTLAGIISEQKIEIQHPDTDPILFGDSQRLCQLWQNLIENAIKFSRSGSIPHIVLAVQQVNGETIFSVSDNGIGIDPRYHDKIFGIFEKINPKSAGAGLGLSMVQRIVEKNSGRVWVESAGIDTGSCFRFTLPGAVKDDEGRG